MSNENKARQGEAVAYVSEESFSSNGTSDIITCNLPIGTALYTAPPTTADAVSVPRELLERLCGATQQSVVPDLATLRTLYVQRMKATDELRALLAQSQEAKP